MQRTRGEPIRTYFTRAVPAAAALVTLLGCSSSQAVDTADAALDAGHESGFDAMGTESAAPESGCNPPGFPDSGVTEGGLPPEDCSGYAYCDDFEAYDAGPLARGEKLGPWTALGGAIDTVRAYTGRQALHVTRPPEPASAGGGLGQTVPNGIVPGNHVFGRAMFYFVEDPGAADGGVQPDGGVGVPVNSHSAFFRATGDYAPADGGVILDVAAGGKTGYDLWFNYFPPHHFEVTSSGATYTSNRWHCLQWELDGSGSAPNQGRIWLDEQLVIDVPQSKGWVWATPWTSFLFGFITLNPEVNAVDVSLDTFALDGKMIPCPPPPGAGCSP